MNDKDEIYEDPESTEVDESEDTDDTGASVEAAVKQEEEIVTMEAAAVNDGDGDGVNTFAAAVVVKDEAVNAKCVGVEAVKGGIMVDESEDTDDTAASVEAAVKQKEEIVAMEAAAVNGGDGVGVNTFAAAIVVEDEAVNEKYMGVEAVKGDILVKGSKEKATAKGRVLTKEEHVEGYETREVLGVKMPRRSERLKKMSQGLDVKALKFKTRKERFKVEELQGSVKPT
ncbi:unnamed protein product [Closterium sp. Naga37s-1]|nr:unnamed protein product [Closterium sp. Naga37s-1]